MNDALSDDRPMSPAAGQPAFLVDHMLIRLGKYLRILGYDAAWDRAHRTHELILQANREGRIFLTRNTRLADGYPTPVRFLVLASTDPVVQLYDLAGRLGLSLTAHLFEKCIRCNLFLETIADKASIREQVPEGVFTRQEQFYRCPGCGTIFWRGSHVRNTCAKLRLRPP